MLYVLQEKARKRVSHRSVSIRVFRRRPRVQNPGAVRSTRRDLLKPFELFVIHARDIEEHILELVIAAARFNYATSPSTHKMAMAGIECPKKQVFASPTPSVEDSTLRPGLRSLEPESLVIRLQFLLVESDVALIASWTRQV